MRGLASRMRWPVLRNLKQFIHSARIAAERAILAIIQPSSASVPVGLARVSDPFSIQRERRMKDRLRTRHLVLSATPVRVSPTAADGRRQSCLRIERPNRRPVSLPYMR